MSETLKYTFEIILEHITVCQKRFSEIKSPSDFVNTEYGNTLLDAIVARIQAIGENIKQINKKTDYLNHKYPAIEWRKIILFRDFISHHYEKLDYEIIYDICETDLPSLRTAIEQEVSCL